MEAKQLMFMKTPLTEIPYAVTLDKVFLLLAGVSMDCISTCAVVVK